MTNDTGFARRGISVLSLSSFTHSKNNMDNKFAEGSVVYAIAKPTVKLIIKRYVDRVYYCRAQLDPAQKQLTFFERELTNEGPPATEPQ